MQIETERLIITEFTEQMSESVYKNSLDDDTKKYIPDEVYDTIEKAQETVRFLITCYNKKTGPFVYPILLKDGNNIGYVQIVKMENDWEIGYHIAKKYTGKGYSTEAVKAFIPVILKILKPRCIYGVCLKENIASQKVLEKNNFIIEFCGLANYQGEQKLIKKYRYDNLY